MATPKLITVIEDYDSFRYSLRQLLEFEGYEVAEAADGEAGLALLEEITPDMILLDLTLPGIDGISTARKIRESERLHSIPIFALSAHDLPDLQSEAIAAGCNCYLTKPIDFDELNKLLKDHLG